MDVNQTNSIAAVHSDARRNKQETDHPSDTGNGKEDDKSPSGSWRDQDAVNFDHRLIDALTPEVQEMINALNQEIEPLRRKLSAAEKQLEELRQKVSQHVFLNVASHAEMRRDLEHVLSHRENLSISPVFVLMSVSNGDQVRLKYGRSGRERYLKEICQRISAHIKSADTFGSLGGNDFGLILLGTDLVVAQQSIATLTEEIVSVPISLSGDDVTVEMSAGAIDLRFIDSVDVAITTADKRVFQTNSAY